jgi:hypothetical protein
MERIHRKVGLSQCGNIDVSERMMLTYRESGIEALELSCPANLADLPAAYFTDARKNAAAAGVELWTAHLPFVPFDTINIASLDKAVRASTVKLLSEIIRRYSESGVKTFVIHPSGEPNLDADRPNLLAASCESLATLAEVAAEVGSVIAVEDLPRTCLGRDSGEIKTLLSADDRVLIIDDFLACGNAMIGLMDLVRQAGGEVVGVSAAIEKGYQGGGDKLRAENIRVESLAIIDEMTENGIRFR